ncbi:MAG: nitroreductase [Desulfarculus sp.]|nr:nitroreductase [Desulfarculus sp.]
MQAAQLLELIQARRSVRRFSAQPVDDALLADILEAGRWAPSGQNNQAWRFLVVRGEALKERIAQCTKYGAVVRGAPVLIPVFIHKPSMYNEVKDHQAMGACLQNMLLMIHGLGLGGVWLGEILNQADKVRQILSLPPEYELMAVLALGWPAATNQKSQRKPMSELMLSATEP